MRAAAFAAAALSCLCLPAAASAQGAAASPRVRIGVSVGVESIDATSAQHFAVDKNLEPAPITATVAFKTAPLFDGAVSVRVAGGFGVGVAVSTASSTRTAGVTAGVPSPFVFSQRRPIDGTASIRRRETATHVDAIYVFAAPHGVEIVVSGGPTIFAISQTLVTDVSYTDAYPFDTAAFGAASTSTVSRTAVGYNIGVDAAWAFTHHVGVGGLVRFARATTTLSAGGNNSVDVDAGGLQAGGGLRVWF